MIIIVILYVPVDDSFPVNVICCSEVAITSTSQMVVAGLATNEQ